jgi:hypothetical protein
MPQKQKPIHEKRTRVRSKRLDQLDESKLALALWLLARQMVEADDSQPDRLPSKAELP